jgi:cytochrome oxidase assembly protein ShyY1
MWSVARRPRWIAMLFLALVVAAGFAALSQWQLERSVSTGTVIVRDTETPVQLNTVAKPQSAVTSASSEQDVTVTGTWVAKDYLVLSDRLNKSETGYWVVGHLATDVGNTRAGLAVAMGWAPTKAAADAAKNALVAEGNSGQVTVVGRYLPTEAPEDSDFLNGKQSSLAVAALVNLWQPDPDGIYGGYVVIHSAVAGLERIDSPPPSTEVEVNWLNIFYAIEWVVFAGFAIFFWWRLVKDTWEREQEEAREEALAGS